MQIERGTVERTTNHTALVRIQRTAECDGCEAKGACHIGGGKEMLIDVGNHLHAGVGDMVEVGLPAYSVLKMGFIVYIFPVLALILGAYAGNALAGSLHIQADSAAIMGGLGTLGISFYALKRIDRSMKKRPEYQPRMTRILFSGGPPAPSADSR